MVGVRSRVDVRGGGFGGRGQVSMGQMSRVKKVKAAYT